METYDLKASSKHKPISNGDDNNVGDDRGGDTAGEEVFDVEVALTGSLVLHHDGSYRTLDPQQQHYQECTMTYSYWESR